MGRSSEVPVLSPELTREPLPLPFAPERQDAQTPDPYSPKLVRPAACSAPTLSMLPMPFFSDYRSFSLPRLLSSSLHSSRLPPTAALQVEINN